MSNKMPYGTYALQTALQQLRKIEPDLLYQVDDCSSGKIFNGFLIARNKTRFRPLGILDWAHFTMAGLRVAIQYDILQQYYEEMLKDPRSPSNNWKDKDKEKKLKALHSNNLGGYNE
jgi:hypothetical protein|tara:strand:+ start:312 stop:662 length:351 start_codon:yes stop_codon:yes gene_type:complete